MLRRHWLIALGIWAVLAAGATAAPKYKALVVDGQNGHKWQETTPVLKKILEDTGMFTVDVATSPAKGKDMSGFKPNFAAYNVVVSNYQGDPWPKETEKALADYVRKGGGLVVYHFACAAFPKWKEYNEMIGLGGWGGRNEKSGPHVRWRDGKIVRMKNDTVPGTREVEVTDPATGKKTKKTVEVFRAGSHGPMQPFQVVIRDPNHPITKGLPEKFMHVDDELYGWLRGPAKNLTVLATAFAPKDKGGSDENEPVLLTVSYGKGRVFQNALGHTGKELKSVAFIATFQRGVEWAASGKVTQKVPADFPTADKASVRP
jgi:type 1 glutamine amidotransferase